MEVTDCMREPNKTSKGPPERSIKNLQPPGLMKNRSTKKHEPPDTGYCQSAARMMHNTDLGKTLI